MHPLLEKTFGGLSLQYFMRQFIFGVAISVFVGFMAARGPSGISVSLLLMCIISALLYPYSRFVYESIANFILGENTFFVNAFLMLFVKIMTMVLCWSFSIFIAPIGLAYLYFHHSKAAS
jgi:hypothetical protein